MKNIDTFQVKKTPLYEQHVESGAKIVDFFGWALPMEYTGILKEAKAARKKCVLFDASHMGQIRVVGKDAESFLQRLTSNDISKIGIHRLQYNLFLKPEGTILDDCMIYNTGKGFLCVVNAANKDKVFKWLFENKPDSIGLVDESTTTALLSLQGPNAEKIMQGLIGDIAYDLKYMHFIETTISDAGCMISRSGYTGEDGFEIYFRTKDAPWVWDAIVSAGKKFSLSLGGLGARDILRIEAGYPLYGHEINEFITPVEASLRWALKLDAKDCLGKPTLMRQIETGINRVRVGFIMEDRGVPREECVVYNSKKIKIGKVSSGTFSPNLNKFIGMAYVNVGFSSVEDPIFIKIRKTMLRAKIVKMPFV